MHPFQTSQPKVMETSNLACALTFVLAFVWFWFGFGKIGFELMTSSQ